MMIKHGILGYPIFRETKSRTRRYLKYSFKRFRLTFDEFEWIWWVFHLPSILPTLRHLATPWCLRWITPWRHHPSRYWRLVVDGRWERRFASATPAPWTEMAIFQWKTASIGNRTRTKMDCLWLFSFWYTQITVSPWMDSLLKSFEAMPISVPSHVFFSTVLFVIFASEIIILTYGNQRGESEPWWRLVGAPAAPCGAPVAVPHVARRYAVIFRWPGMEPLVSPAQLCGSECCILHPQHGYV